MAGQKRLSTGKAVFGGGKEGFGLRRGFCI